MESGLGVTHKMGLQGSLKCYQKCDDICKHFFIESSLGESAICDWKTITLISSLDRGVKSLKGPLELPDADHPPESAWLAAQFWFAPWCMEVWGQSWTAEPHRQRSYFSAVSQSTQSS